MMRRDGLAEADEALCGMQKHLEFSDGEPNRRCLEGLAGSQTIVIKAAVCAGHGDKGLFIGPIRRDRCTLPDLEEIVERLKVATDRGQSADRSESRSACSAAYRSRRTRRPSLKRFELYVSKIAFDDQYNKSDAQRRAWEKTKRTSIDYFIEQIGDIPLSEITRDVATKYRDWWQSRMLPQKDGSKPITPNTANRHIGNMRSLYKRYFKYRGETDIEDPFRGFLLCREIHRQACLVQ